MAEYHMTYLNLRKRLHTQKLLAETDTKLSDDERQIKLNKVDMLLKNLDERYDECFPLSYVESNILELENKK